MSESPDPLLVAFGQQILGYDQDRVNIMIGIFHDTIEAMLAENAPVQEVIWALTGLLIAWVREDEVGRLDRLKLIQAMISLRMGMADRLEAETNKGKVN